jgi:hypothetical protein
LDFGPIEKEMKNVDDIALSYESIEVATRKLPALEWTNQILSE